MNSEGWYQCTTSSYKSGGHPNVNAEVFLFIVYIFFTTTIFINLRKNLIFINLRKKIIALGFLFDGRKWFTHGLKKNIIKQDSDS